MARRRARSSSGAFQQVAKETDRRYIPSFVLQSPNILIVPRDSVEVADLAPVGSRELTEQCMDAWGEPSCIVGILPRRCVWIFNGALLSTVYVNERLDNIDKNTPDY